jgi:hypothetical protein
MMNPKITTIDPEMMIVMATPRRLTLAYVTRITRKLGDVATANGQITCRSAGNCQYLPAGIRR